MRRAAVLLSLVAAHAAAAPTPVASPFTLDSRWVLDFREVGSGRSAERVAFTVVGVEQDGPLGTAFGLVAGGRSYSVLAVADTRDGTLSVTDLTPGAAGRVRICALGTARPPAASGLTLTAAPGGHGRALADLRVRLAAVRAASPRLSPLAQVRAAAGVRTGGALCTVRRAP